MDVVEDRQTLAGLVYSNPREAPNCPTQSSPYHPVGSTTHPETSISQGLLYLYVFLKYQI